MTQAHMAKGLARAAIIFLVVLHFYSMKDKTTACVTTMVQALLDVLAAKYLTCVGSCIRLGLRFHQEEPVIGAGETLCSEGYNETYERR